LNSFSDEDMRRIRKGDNEPLGRLFNKHYSHCIKILSSLERCSRLEAEDSFMDAIQVLREKILRGTFEHDNLRGFLLVTSKNKLLNKQKRDRRTIDLDVEKVEQYLHSKKSPHALRSSDLSNEQERKVDYILQAREMLGDSCKKLLHMNFDLGYKLKELVLELGYSSYDSLKTTKSRCLKTLRKKVSELMELTSK